MERKTIELTNRFQRLSLNDKFTVITLWVQLACMDIRLKLLPHKWNSGLLYQKSISIEPDDSGKKIINNLIHLVSIAADRPLLFNMTCLRRSLVLRTRLKKVGVTATLVFGVGKNIKKSELNGSFSAHAWLEAGSLIIDSLSDPAGLSRFN
ncbi:MAG: lasso peptide biosynthesis B2 protein [Bacteroidetes bacterium]|nr:lasso peptide biosynthesis B2 protein [Bacteroidota bacterium]